MQVQVTGKHVDLGEALRSRISDELTGSIGKYFERGGDAEVVLSRDGSGFRADCVVTLASGQRLDSHGLAPDAHAAFDSALTKVETRIRRYKRRLKNHHHPSREPDTTTEFVLLAPDEDADGWDALDDDAGYTGHEPPSALVVAETETAIRTMPVSMAVLELDLTESQTIVFRNAAHGGVSVVYRRTDGNIGWIDPERIKSTNGNGSA